MFDNRITMKELPEAMQPYEKCARYGAAHLTDSELLAVILRTGSVDGTSLDLAEEILKLCPFEDGLTGLHHLTAEMLRRVKGIGKVKACLILCVAELSIRIARASARRGLSFREPETIADYYMESMRHLDCEEVYCMLLDARNRLLGERRLSSGTIDAALITPRDIFSTALEYHAKYVVLIHNHPSGDPTPCGEDLFLTKRVAEAGELLDIRLLDHLVIGDLDFYSFRQGGLLE